MSFRPSCVQELCCGSGRQTSVPCGSLAGPVAAATSYGVGELAPWQSGSGAAVVKFPWGTGYLAQSSVDTSRGAIVAGRARTLASILSILVADLPRLSTRGESCHSGLDLADVTRVPTPCRRSSYTIPACRGGGAFPPGFELGSSEARRTGCTSNLGAAKLSGPTALLLKWLVEAAIEPHAEHLQKLLEISPILEELAAHCRAPSSATTPASSSGLGVSRSGGRLSLQPLIPGDSTPSSPEGLAWKALQLHMELLCRLSVPVLPRTSAPDSACGMAGSAASSTLGSATVGSTALGSASVSSAVGSALGYVAVGSATVVESTRGQEVVSLASPTGSASVAAPSDPAGSAGSPRLIWPGAIHPSQAPVRAHSPERSFSSPARRLSSGRLAFLTSNSGSFQPPLAAVIVPVVVASPGSPHLDRATASTGSRSRLRSPNGWASVSPPRMCTPLRLGSACRSHSRDEYGTPPVPMHLPMDAGVLPFSGNATASPIASPCGPPRASVHAASPQRGLHSTLHASPVMARVWCPSSPGNGTQTPPFAIRTVTASSSNTASRMMPAAGVVASVSAMLAPAATGVPTVAAMPLLRVVKPVSM